jgi:hypothetical protein
VIARRVKSVNPLALLNLNLDHRRQGPSQDPSQDPSLKPILSHSKRTPSQLLRHTIPTGAKTPVIMRDASE